MKHIKYFFIILMSMLVAVLLASCVANVGGNQNKDTDTYYNIYPISKNEIKLGIWKESPYDSLSKFFN